MPELPARSLMDRTVAGAHRCELAKSHERPFVIEWDATDLASFEAKAARDVVFVRHDGCAMSIIYGCSDTSIPGHYGAYLRPVWTSGNVEAVEMADVDRLYAALPLGAAALEGHVERGQSLDLRYNVSGVATATREVIYRSDLTSNRHCAAATHFVWAYNLGAFELAASERAAVDAGVRVAGLAGGRVGGERARVVLKQGGRLTSCDTHDQLACRVPIRLHLRAIDDGAPPPMATAADPPSKKDSTTSDAQRARVLRRQALDKLQSGDGSACLGDLDRALALDPRPSSYSIETELRGRCLMRAGRCEEGRARMRSYYKLRDRDARQLSDDTLEMLVSNQVVEHCAHPLGSVSERARRAAKHIARACVSDDEVPGNVQACRLWAERLRPLLDSLPQRTTFERDAHHWAKHRLMDAGRFIGNAGHCDEGWPHFKSGYRHDRKAPYAEGGFRGLVASAAYAYTDRAKSCVVNEGSIEDRTGRLARQITSAALYKRHQHVYSHARALIALLHQRRSNLRTGPSALARAAYFAGQQGDCAIRDELFRALRRWDPSAKLPACATPPR